MNRYKEWMDKGYKIGSAWGLFSCGIPHRVRLRYILAVLFAHICLNSMIGRLSVYELLS